MSSLRRDARSARGDEGEYGSNEFEDDDDSLYSGVLTPPRSGIGSQQTLYEYDDDLEPTRGDRGSEFRREAADDENRRDFSGGMSLAEAPHTLFQPTVEAAADLVYLVLSSLRSARSRTDEGYSDLDGYRRSNHLDREELQSYQNGDGASFVSSPLPSAQGSRMQSNLYEATSCLLTGRDD